jgi:hypothetical protein
VAPFLQLLTSQYIDDRDGVANVLNTEFREHGEQYREAWLAWRKFYGSADGDQ